jgi:hypothetical protein
MASQPNGCGVWPEMSISAIMALSAAVGCQRVAAEENGGKSRRCIPEEISKRQHIVIRLINDNQLANISYSKIMQAYLTHLRENGNQCQWQPVSWRRGGGGSLARQCGSAWHRIIGWLTSIENSRQPRRNQSAAGGNAASMSEAKIEIWLFIWR